MPVELEDILDANDALRSSFGIKVEQAVVTLQAALQHYSITYCTEYLRPQGCGCLPLAILALS